MSIRHALTHPTGRRIRRWSLAIGMALLLAAWTVLFAQLVGGHVATVTHDAAQTTHRAPIAAVVRGDRQATAYRS